MKHFKVIGPDTTTEFDIEENEVLEWRVVAEVQNKKDYKTKVES